MSLLTREPSLLVSSPYLFSFFAKCFYNILRSYEFFFFWRPQSGSGQANRLIWSLDVTPPSFETFLQLALRFSSLLPVLDRFIGWPWLVCSSPNRLFHFFPAYGSEFFKSFVVPLESSLLDFSFQ